MKNMFIHFFMTNSFTIRNISDRRGVGAGSGECSDFEGAAFLASRQRGPLFRHENIIYQDADILLLLSQVRTVGQRSVNRS